MRKSSFAIAGAGCALSFGYASAADITTATTAPVSTSAVGDVNITSSGSITLTAPGSTAVTLDSNNTVLNQGAIDIANADNATGILIVGGVTGNVRSTSTITVDEDYTRPDTDSDNDLDGPYAIGSGRTGILLDNGGAFSGNISIAGGAVTVEGNQSAVVRLQSVLNGLFANDGTLSVVGDDAFGVDAQQGVTGNFLQSGVITSRGLNAVGVSIKGDVGGAVTNEGSVVATGFASTTLTNYADPDTLDADDIPIADRIDADDLLAGGPAFAIGGNVANGFLNNGAIGGRASDDTVKDAIEDFDENRSAGQIASFGSGPAILISPDWSGVAGDIVIGEVVETVRDTTDDDEDDDTEETLATFNYDFGIINRGSIISNGLNVGFESTALRIEGSADDLWTTTISGGIYNAGGISSRGFEADSAAVSLGGGAIVGRLENFGTISAGVLTETNHSAVGILIDEGASLQSITNSGVIVTSVRGYEGIGAGILDLSGTLQTIVNNGNISATFVSIDEEDLGLGSAAAIDVSSHGAGAPVTIVQTMTGTNAPLIVGDVLLGAGDDVFDVQAGSVFSDVMMGAGGDQFLVSDAMITGAVDFGAGADQFSLADGATFTGSIVDADGTLIIDVADSTLSLTSFVPLTVDTLTITGASIFAVSADLAEDDLTAPRITATNAATVGGDTEIRALLTNFRNAPTTIGLIESPNLSIAAGAVTDIVVNAPAIFASEVILDATRLSVSLAPKSAAQLGLNTNQSAAFAPFLELAAGDDVVGTALTSYFDETELTEAYASLMPVTADTATRFLSGEASLATGALAQRFDLIMKEGARASGFWVQEHVTFMRQNESIEASANDGVGMNLQAGYDHAFAESFVLGVAASFQTGKFKTTEDLSKQDEATAYQIQPYAAFRSGAFAFDVAGSAAIAEFNSTRRVSFGDVNDIIEGKRRGSAFAGAARVSYEASSGRYYARPALSVDYFRLHQNSFEEVARAESTPYALAFEAADTTRATASAVVNLGRRAGDFERKEGSVATYGALGGFTEATSYFQSIYFGYRLELDADLYSTQARFLEGGDPFPIFDPVGYENAVLFGFSIGFSNDLFALSIGYDGEFAGDLMRHRAGANFRMRF